MADRSTKSIPIFNEVSKCLKCGGDNCKALYEPPIDEDPCWFTRRRKKMPEHEFILRTCLRCQYQWPERVVKP